MGVFGMSMGISFGMAPALGGLINDNLGPVFIWYIMTILALLSAVFFFALGRRTTKQEPEAEYLPAAEGSIPLTNPEPRASHGRHTHAESSLE
jgi:MFS family permease